MRLAILGCGGMARHHTEQMLEHAELVTIPVVSEPSTAAYDRFAALYTARGISPPPNEPDLGRLLLRYVGLVDAVFIITPHVFHYDQAARCMEAGLDVLLEKPMVMNAHEARSLIQTRDRTGRLLVVAFNGSLSPQIRMVVRLLSGGELGRILNIHGVVWQSWRAFTDNTWRQNPAISGGGFFFDTGAHLLNTVADLAGEPFVDLAAWLDTHGASVDLTGVVMARLASGTLVTLSACGDTVQSCASDVRVFCTEGILRTGVWGECLEIQRQGETALTPVVVPPSYGAWEVFVHVWAGKVPNPSPPEVGLRMALLWDMIRLSAARGGRSVKPAEVENVAG